MESEKVSIRDPMMEDTDVDDKQSKKKEIIKVVIIIGVILLVIGVGLT